MKPKTVAVAIIIAVILVSLMYFTYQNYVSVKSPLVGLRLNYYYYVMIPANGTYVSLISVNVTKISNGEVYFKYTIKPLNQSTGTISNQSFVPIFDPRNNMTYFASGYFGMPLFINTSVKPSSGIVTIEFQSQESAVIKYTVSTGKEIYVNLTIIPYLGTYNLGETYWDLSYNPAYGYLVSAKGSFIGANYIKFEYVLVNASV